MKKIDDSRIYLYTAIVTLAIGIILGAISFYSILIVEAEVERLLSSKENIDENYKKAYIILRDPQIFAGYENFDSERVKKSLAFFDSKIYSNEKIDPDAKIYMEILLDRRKQGSILGRNTMVFFLLLSVISCIMYFHERKAARE